MTPTPNLPENSLSPGSSIPPTRLRRRIWFASTTCVLLGIGAGSWFYFHSERAVPAAPPTLPTTDGIDAEVVRAIEAKRQAVSQSPQSAADWGNLGMAFGAHGFETEAETCFTEAERLDATDARWPYFRGTYAALRHPAEAIPYLERALSLADAAPEAHSAIRLRLAEIWFDRGDLDNAEIHFLAELGSLPGQPRAQLGLGQIALSRGNRAAAREAFRAVVDSPYTRKRACIQLAALARADNDIPGANHFEELARKAPDDQPWIDPYLRQLGLQRVGQQDQLHEVDRLEAAGRIDEAHQRLRHLIQVDPSPNNLVTTGINLAKSRDFAQAETLFRECLRREPNYTQAHLYLALILSDRAEVSPAIEVESLRNEAVEHLRRVVEASPDHGVAWLYLGRLYLAQGKRKEAVETLEKALSCRPEMVDTHLYLAEALAANGRRDAARAHARDAAKLSEGNDLRAKQFLETLNTKK